MEKLNFLPAAENEEHLARHSDSTSLTIGSKALSTTTMEDIKSILDKTDAAYATMINEQGNPGRKVLGLKTDRYVGTESVVPAEEIESDKIFKITREPGTRGEAEILVALVNAKDMPKTDVIHAVYGPYDPTGNAGIYTMMFGDPGEQFPRKLDENADANMVAANERCKEYWYGKGDGEQRKGGHVFLTTPEELEAAIVAMKECGIPTKIAELRLSKFNKNPVSPIKSHKPVSLAKDAIDLGKIYLKPLVNQSNEKCVEQ